MSPKALTAPEYPFKAIGTLPALEAALGVPLKQLESIASDSDNLYRTVKAKPKSDGTPRQIFDALPKLKSIQSRIKDRLLKRVLFPEYLRNF